MAELDIDEGKLATAIENALADIRFDKFNFVWHMVNKSPRTQGEFWELTYLYIQEMADYYRRGLVDSKNIAVAEMCNDIVNQVNQGRLDFIQP